MSSFDLAAVLAQLGASDCEALGSGLLAQPTNTVSSLAYVGVGLVLARGVTRPGAGARSDLFAALVVATGLGSFAFHGPQPLGARLLHDLPIALALLFVALHDLDLVRPGRDRFATGLVAGGVGATLVAVVRPDALMVLTVLFAVAAGAAEVVVHRTGARPVGRRRQRRAYAAIGGILAVGSASFWLGRTDGALCDPAAIVQFHGLWHIATAGALAVWWWLAFAAERPLAARAPDSEAR